MLLIVVKIKSTKLMQILVSCEEYYILLILEVTIARKMLPHPQEIKGSMHNSLNKWLFI